MPKSSRALYSRFNNFVAVDFQIFRRAEQIDGRKAVRFDSQLVADRRVAKAMQVFDKNLIRLGLEEHEAGLQSCGRRF